MSIRAYNVTGELDIRREPFTLGTRVLLDCHVTGVSDRNEVVSFTASQETIKRGMRYTRQRPILQSSERHFWWTSLHWTTERGTTAL